MTPQYIILYRYRTWKAADKVFSNTKDVISWLNAADPGFDYQVYSLGTPLNVIKHTTLTYEITT